MPIEWWHEKETGSKVAQAAVYWKRKTRTGLQAIYYEHDVSIRMVRSNLLHTRRYIWRRENVVAPATRGKIFLHSKSLIHNSSRITSMKASMQATFHLLFFFFLFHSDNEASKRPILELHYICHGLCSRDYWLHKENTPGNGKTKIRPKLH